MVVGIRQQRQVARVLYSPGKLALVTRLGTGYAAGYNLAGFADVLLEHVDVFVIDFGNSLSGEATEFPASELTSHDISPVPDQASALSASAAFLLDSSEASSTGAAFSTSSAASVASAASAASVASAAVSLECNTFVAPRITSNSI